MKKSLAVLALFGLGIAACAPAVASKPYPNGPISIVVPFAPGGATDTTARLLAKELARDTGYNFIVENKAGAGGGIAASYVARARPDGQTLLFGTTSTNGINTYIYPKLPYDAVKSFAPVGFVAENVVVLLGNASFPANNLTETVELLRKNPGKYAYASPGVGTVHNLAMELLKHSLGLDVRHIPYKGAGPAMVDLVSGTVPLMMGGIAPALPFVKSGKIKVLGVANDRHFNDLPAGIQYFSDVAPKDAVSSWMGLLAPAGTPADRIEVLSAALKKALASKTLQQTLEQQGMHAAYMTPQQFGTLITQGMSFWKSAAQVAGIENH
ncbi:Bug family tripartite tricarboxylate transporter substrate binding protein [Candidimonas nitroreducens]|uniref:ABC transporter substrate-binding protein n=1 Tax=Candidimonas nitroreducens TaxID=683354 RepID=A0A225MLC8_9BURK|nr:tripartite tricarboxylate transporter substrate-binding protein [Candidimonas nitroreducens]OWT61975.1 ABC transporter substrate-binding protein [Candidimonas nitroreducens]